MKKEEIIVKFSKALFNEHSRKNAVTIRNISSTLIEASLTSSFVNESCKSTEEISKSQIIYRKLDANIDKIEFSFRDNARKFLRMLKIYSRNRKFFLSFDTTEEPFYGKLNKGEDNLYLHNLTYPQKGAKYCYKYLTLAITCSNGTRYILDGIILKRGAYIEDYVYEMTKFVKENIPIGVVLFDRGFGWGVIYKLQQLNVRYMVFWKKQGSWYKKHFSNMKDGEFCEITKNYKYNKDKTNYKVESKFVLIKQHKYEGKEYDWIFATNLDKESAGKYVMRYKKRWGIETIFRVTDDIRIYTTSTNPLIRYFLFMFTCFVYNVWKFFQSFIGESFTLANFSTNMNKFIIEKEMIKPKHYKEFISVFNEYNNPGKKIKRNS
jgi:putative transposase